MIYIRVELWPGGDKKRATVLAEAEIANISNLSPRSSYRYQLYGKKGAPMGFGQIHHFPRKRLMAWDLIYRVLKDARGDRNEADISSTRRTECNTVVNPQETVK